MIKLPTRYYEGLKSHFQANGLPWIPSVVEEIVYQIGRHGLEENTPNAIRFYREGSRSQFDSYKHLESSGKGSVFEMRCSVNGEPFIIGCNYKK